MCHGGFPWVDEFLAVAHSNPNVWVDISFLDHIERTFRAVLGGNAARLLALKE